MAEQQAFCLSVGDPGCPSNVPDFLLKEDASQSAASRASQSLKAQAHTRHSSCWPLSRWASLMWKLGRWQVKLLWPVPGAQCSAVPAYLLLPELWHRSQDQSILQIRKLLRAVQASLSIIGQNNACLRTSHSPCLSAIPILAPVISGPLGIQAYM